MEWSGWLLLLFVVVFWSLMYLTGTNKIKIPEWVEIIFRIVVAILIISSLVFGGDDGSEDPFSWCHSAAMKPC